MSFRRTLPSLLALLAIAVGCYGYSNFQQQIPNGEMVPHPCKANFIWRGVGHDNHLGGGARNAFGVDFNNNNKVWDPTLCNKDSDGDGKTNGEELGDPDCTWTPGAEPKHRAGLSHPGICDPFDNPRCGGKPDFVDCTKLDFKCDAIEEPEIVNFTIRVPETAVPPVVTVYECMVFDIPDLGGKEHHIVADMPYIDTEDILHHIIVYGCTGDVFRPRDEPYACYMRVDEDNCTDVIGSWSVGVPGRCMDPNVGFLIGGTKGYKTAAIVMHWNNPQKKSDYVDSSGMTFFATPKLRPYNGGTMMVGQHYLQLPPGREATPAHGRCEGSCTKRMLSGDINVVSVGHHMHYLGAAQITTLHRNGERVADLAVDQTYSYDTPNMHDHRKPIVVKPGDDIDTTCVYKTTSRTKTVFWGDATADEMCLALLIYYPKENTRMQVCLPWKDIGFCERIGVRTKDGCNLAEMSDFSNPTNLAMMMNITQKCHPLLCVDECKDYIRELRQTNPCFKGQNYEYLLDRSRKNAQAVSTFTRASSCDAELALELNNLQTSDAGITAAIPLCAIITMALAVWYM